MAVNYFSSSAGRGQKATDLTPTEYESALDSIAAKRRNTGRIMVRARCARTWSGWRAESDPKALSLKAAQAAA
ncbi:MAG: hypothetical protein HS130_09040 [Deltaproteobacteria bacterium]|nr:hypothetical protein [Deltaproteobacteria bacterium]